MTDPTAAPQQLPHDHGHHGHGVEQTGTPTEFGLSLIGDANGLAAVLMAFGHLRWQFTPELAFDLGNTLIQAAHQAREHNATHAQQLHPANAAGLVRPSDQARGVRPSGLVIP